MKGIRHTVEYPGLLILLAVLLLAGCTSSPSGYYNLRALSEVEFRDILADIEESRVIFVGEGHTIVKDHMVQMEVIRHLRKKGRKVVIAMEVFPYRLQPLLNDWVMGEIDEAKLRQAYYSTWTVDYSHYKEIFRFARKEGLPILGINADPAYIDYISRYGIERISEKTLKKIKYRECREDPAYMSEMKLIWGRMPHGGEFLEVCNVGRFREAFMAYNLATNMTAGDYTTVVLLGAFHAMKRAVPHMLEIQTGERNFKVMMPDNVKILIGRPLSSDQADYSWQRSPSSFSMGTE